MALPVPRVTADLIDAALSLPAENRFRFVCIRPAVLNVAGSPRSDLVFDLVAASLAECIDHIEYAVRIPCSKVEYFCSLV